VRPLFLLLDGHSSHFQPDLIHFAKDHNIIIFCLPPHTTHESQPLDTVVFGPLKRNWQSVCHEYMQSNPGKIVTKYQFSSLLNQAWMLTMTLANICSGFKKCGIYPCDTNAIDCGAMSSSTIDDQGNNSSGRDKESGMMMVVAVLLMVMKVTTLKMAMSFLLIKNYSFSRGTRRAMICMILSM